MGAVLSHGRFARRFEALVASAGALVLFAACGSNNGGGPPAASLDGAGSEGAGSDDASLDGASPETGIAPVVDARVAEASGDDASPLPPQAQVRVAQLSPDLPPIDICIAPHGTTTFERPLLTQLGGSNDGGDAATPGLGYAQVSAYLSVEAGTYDVRIVGAGADCSAQLSVFTPEPSDGAAAESGGSSAADAGSVDEGLVSESNLPPFSANTYVTILVAGELSPTGGDEGLTVTAIVDDAALAGEAVALRAVNAMPSVPLLDFGRGSFAAGDWVPLLDDVAFASASAHAAPSEDTLDPNGYMPLNPLSSETISARASSGAASDAAVAHSMTIDTGSIATVIAVGGRAGDTAHPSALLLCVDNAPTAGLLSDCSIAK
jgi:hypothetical protein